MTEISVAHHALFHIYWRNLPHWHPTGCDLFITWCLAGVFPRCRVSRDAFIQDEILDRAANGPTWLRQPEIAECMMKCLREGADYDLHCFAIMPNHVHILMSAGTELSKITRSIKGRSAREANLILGRTGQPFWQSESFDHWVRSPTEFRRVRTYIEQNPVKAGLVERPEDWPYSSASPRSTGFSL